MPKKYQDDDSTHEMVCRWIREDMQYWSARNTRFQEDQELFTLTKPGDHDSRLPTDLVILNDPKTIVRKVSALIARHPNVIDVPAAPGVAPEVAQRVENFLYQWDQANNQRWMMGLHAPYRYDQAFYAVLRGWLCERTMLYPNGADYLQDDPAALWDHQIFDPANIYPHVSGNRVDRVTHTQWMLLGEMKNDPFFRDFCDKVCRDDDTGLSERTVIEVRACYWMDRSSDQDNKPSWWYACSGSVGTPGNSNYNSRTGDKAWIKPPTELGYNPWTITIGKGASYRQTPWDNADGFVREVGTGILDEGFDTFKHLSRMATKLQELLSLEANPPVTIYMVNNQIKQVSFSPGSRNYLLAKEKVEPHRIGPSVGDYKILWDILQQRADRATLPGSFFAEYQGQSGFSAATLMAAGKDILFPFVEAINQADALKYRKVLELYRDFGPASPLPVRMPPDGMGRVLSAQITPDDIKRQGTFVEIDRDDMTPQEMVAKINTGLAALREKAISLQTFRKDWAKLKNPDKENLQVLAEQVYLNEQVIAQLVPIALQSTGAEKLRQVWEMVQNPLPPNLPGGPTQTVPGAPPTGPGMPQAPGTQPPTGLPSQAMPPIFQNLLANSQAMRAEGPMMPGADMNPILQMIQGGALGGSGAGGLPPVPGTTSPIQQVMGPMMQMLGGGRRRPF